MSPGPHRFRAAPLLWTLLCWSTISSTASALGTPEFPCTEELRPRVTFWMRIFTEFGSSQRVIHDARYPWIIYEVMDVTNHSQAEINKKIKARKEHYDELLERLVLREPSQYTPEEQRVSDLFAEVPEAARFTRARERIRSQPGVREQMIIGIRRSGRYLDRISEILAEYGVPQEVAYLPHVESSFHPGVESKAGAIGLWQFTRSTGRNYLRIENDLDERLDPYAATTAAAQYLRHAHDCLESWPLAVTAYNHGLNGMMRAKERLGTTDVARVLSQYDGPAFGFASQNFYCEFLAVVEVSRDSERYFGPLMIDPPHVVDTFELPDYVKLGPLAEAFRTPRKELLELNPALGKSYAQGSRHLPKGYVLRLPLGRVADTAAGYACVPSSERSPSNPLPPGYTVRPGDTLARIARRHRVTVDTIRSMNNIGKDNRIIAGQVLVLPESAYLTQ